MRIGAGNGTRTRDPELGRLALYQLSYSRQKMVEREGFEPSKASPADLQSAPFGHSGTSPIISSMFAANSHCDSRTASWLELAIGLEPTTC